MMGREDMVVFFEPKDYEKVDTKNLIIIMLLIFCPSYKGNMHIDSAK